MQAKLTLAIACLTMAGLGGVPTARANHDCFDASPIDGDDVAIDTVYDPALPSWYGASRFYVHAASSTHVGYSLVSGVGSHAQANLVDADLYVWGDQTCTWTMCESHNGAGLADTCAIPSIWPGVHVIEVRFVSSHEAHVDYTLATIH